MGEGSYSACPQPTVVLGLISGALVGTPCSRLECLDPRRQTMQARNFPLKYILTRCRAV